MTRFTLSRPAASDLYDIDTYIAEDDPKAAERVIAELEASMQLIAEMPRIGTLRPELGDDVYRFFPVGSYLIVYLPDTKPLEVVRVLHQSRDIPRRLHQDAA